MPDRRPRSRAVRVGGRTYTFRVVPLSEREQRILEEIERNLKVEDPRFASGRDQETATNRKNNIKFGGLLFFVGLAILLGFFLSGSVLIGVLAFGAMVAGIVIAAGAVDGLAASGRAQKDRMTGAFAQWERRLRDKYRRR